jgi:tetratricopeptide (TPR) repeat protein
MLVRTRFCCSSRRADTTFRFFADTRYHHTMRGRFTVVGTLCLAATLALATGAYLYAREEATELGSIALPVPPLPPRITDDPVYADCLNLLPEDPVAARSLITTRPFDPIAARHCLALTVLAEGRLSEGAELLERLADATGLGDGARVVLLGQAADAWFQARDFPLAQRAASKALSLSPTALDIRLRHARIAARMGRERDAIADLTRVLEASPDRVDALRERAMAWRRLDRNEQARADIDRAARFAPKDPEVLLERGIQRQRMGDLVGARADWRLVIALDPDTEVADLAEQNLALLDAGAAAR